ncbi:MAG: tRNA threonylcarbamoyladenosine biosynthesis protein RimN [Thiomicrospira sp.]|nr:MAG: tRNA threonylcarbamoyladenosine biosynthesis protein RimN [Thiomicrospira sp.]
MNCPLLTIKAAASVITEGGVLAYPTEAVYGLGCDPLNKDAFQQLLQLKQRPLEKGVILIASSVSQVEPFVKLHNQAWTEKVLASWQVANQPITWVLPATDKVPEWITGGRSTVAVRVTQHPDVMALCNQLGFPIVSTSANVSGTDPVTTLADCCHAFPGLSIMQGSLMGIASPSQIWDAQSQTRLR